MTSFAATAKDYDSENVTKISGDFSDADISIKYYDRTMYYPGNTDENPVFVRVTVSNRGTDTLRFKLADDRMFSVDFSAYTVKNTKIPESKNLTRKRTTNQTVYFREIALESGEEYSFVENVKEYLDISEPSMYYLELNFYPELYRAKENAVLSNRLSLEIRPAPTAASSVKIPVQEKTAVVLQPEKLSPDKVVEETIIARQKSLWDKYFLYMDLEQMLKRSAIAARQYELASADERERMLANYKADLMSERIDRDIVAVPVRFEVERTAYTNQNGNVEGTVSVVEWFRYETFEEKKLYTYNVRQRDDIWQIFGYDVDNLGTE